jgi:hypothetical protein
MSVRMQRAWKHINQQQNEFRRKERKKEERYEKERSKQSVLREPFCFAQNKMGVQYAGEKIATLRRFQNLKESVSK